MTQFLPLVVVAGLFAQQAVPPKVELDPPVTLAFAGVKIALPKGFELQTSADMSIVLNAAKVENKQPVLAVMLSGYRQPANASLISFAEFGKAKSGLVIRNLKLIKTGALRIAGREAEIRIIAFDYRGVETTALRVFFLRPLASASMQMGYVLSVEGAKGRGRQLLPILGAIGNTIELFDPVRPIAQKITSLGEPMVSRKWGYSVRPPRWWKARMSRQRDTVEMVQVDYLPNARPPQASLQVKAEAASAEASAKTALNLLRESLKEQKVEFQVVREGPVRMAGRQGYEFLVRRDAARGDSEKEKPKVTLFIGQRTVCSSGNSYSLVAYYLTDKVEQVTAAIDTIAAGLELMTPVTTAPAAEPATALPGLPPLPGTAPSPAAPSGLPARPGSGPSSAPSGVIVPKYQE